MSGTNFPSGQENINTVVMMTNASRVVKAADRRDGITVFFQRFEGTGKLVITAGFGDLVIEGVDAVGEIDEGAAFGRGDLFGRLERGHAFEHGEGNAGTHGPKGMATVDTPGL